MREYRRVERIFALPSQADADIVAEIVRAIISSAVSTESLVLDTSDVPKIIATIFLPAAPEREEEEKTLWDVLHSVQLTDHHFEGEDSPFVIRREFISSAIQELCNQGSVPVGLVARNLDQLRGWFGIKEGVRLLGVPMYPVNFLDEDLVAVLGGPSATGGVLRADKGVLIRMRRESHE